MIVSYLMLYIIKRTRLLVCPFSLISESLSILLPLAILGVVRRWGGTT